MSVPAHIFFFLLSFLLRRHSDAFQVEVYFTYSYNLIWQPPSPLPPAMMSPGVTVYHQGSHLLYFRVHQKKRQLKMWSSLPPSCLRDKNGGPVFFVVFFPLFPSTTWTDCLKMKDVAPSVKLFIFGAKIKCKLKSFCAQRDSSPLPPKDYLHAAELPPRAPSLRQQ